MAAGRARLAGVDVRCFTVGPVAENCYLVRESSAPGARALLVDPGDEPDRLAQAIDSLQARVEAILITHCHFDHIGAVAPMARKTGAPVWVPAGEQHVLADINSYVPWPGFGPFESWQAEHTVVGGERLELAGLTIEVIATPGHSPAHVSYWIADELALFSGDVLFRGSVGRTDLPGADWNTLLASIRALLDRLPGETVVYPGHMGITTLERERLTNPFLAEVAR